MMIYGAAGYTGSMTVKHAASAGLDLVLAGRDQNRLALEALAEGLGAEVRLFSLDDPAAIGRALEGIAVVLNTAGPFMNMGRYPVWIQCFRLGSASET